MIVDVYQNYLSTNNTDEIAELFLSSIIDTNRTHQFFVDWEKIKGRLLDWKIEINILNSLIGTKNFNKDMKHVLSNYPEVLPLLPILIAVRDLDIKVIKDFSKSEVEIENYNFKKRQLTESEIEKHIQFCEYTGIKEFFISLSNSSLVDYILGVEVGMDTNARKNRSGKAMENLIEPILLQINETIGLNLLLLKQKNFKYLSARFGLDIASNISNRKSDFILIDIDRKITCNIEVNFYTGTGSKPQEIVDSYINRQRELSQNKIHFIWITDGGGWKGQRNQTKKAIQEIDYLLNLRFARRGMLNDIIWKIFKHDSK